MTKKAKVLLVDDHSVVIEGIRRAIEEDEDIEIVGAANDGLAALPLVKSLKPDVVVMDISMPNLDGIEATQAIKKINRNTGIIIFTMYRDREYILSLFKMGVSGYVFKDESIQDLVMAIHSIAKGGTFYSKAAQDILREHMEKLEKGARANPGEKEDEIMHLSLREMEVFPLLADGLSIKEIAVRLCISPKTVESHKYNIMEKLGVESIAGLTKLAIRKSLIKA
jgi:DNA-binding NarL/FixJ family response regulator